jgi:tetratricopeptide (TPR) repeat protein
MPADIADMLGEANMLFAFTDLAAAREKLLEVIRQWPTVPDAYHTLGLIHEEEGEAGRALECFIIAAHLTGKDDHLWRRLADMSREQKNYQQAIYCLNRALRLRMDPEYLWEKSSLLTSVGQPKKATDCLVALLRKLPASEKQQRFNACKELARLYHQAVNPSQ